MHALNFPLYLVWSCIIQNLVYKKRSGFYPSSLGITSKCLEFLPISQGEPQITPDSSCTNEMTQTGASLPGSLGVGLAMPGKPIMSLEGWGFEPLDISLTFREGKKVGDWVQLGGTWFTQSWLHDETPIKPLDTEDQWNFPDTHWCALRMAPSDSMWKGHRSSVVETLPDLTHASLLLTSDLYPSLAAIKLQIVRISWILWVVLAIYWTWEGTPVL